MVLARYKDGTKESIVKIEDVHSRSDYLENYVGKLFCIGENCAANVGFVEGQLSGRRNSFRTIRGEIHRQGCENEIDRSKERAPRKGGGVLVVAMTKEHIRGVLKRARNKSKGIVAKPRYDIKRKAKSNPVNEDLGVDSSPRIISTVNPNAVAVSETERKIKSAPVWDKHCNNILPDDIGMTLCVYGDLKKVHIAENIIKLEYNSNLDKPLYMEFFTPFRQGNQQIFDLMKNFDKLSEAYKDEPIIMYGVGLLTEKNGEYTLEMHEPTHFYINDDNYIKAFKRIRDLNK